MSTTDAPSKRKLEKAEKKAKKAKKEKKLKVEEKQEKVISQSVSEPQPKSVSEPQPQPVASSVSLADAAKFLEKNEIKISDLNGKGRKQKLVSLSLVLSRCPLSTYIRYDPA